MIGTVSIRSINRTWFASSSPPTSLVGQSHCFHLSRCWNNKRLRDNLSCLRGGGEKKLLRVTCLFLCRCSFSIHALLRHVFTGERLCILRAFSTTFDLPVFFFILFSSNALPRYFKRHLFNNQQSIKSRVSSLLQQFVSDNTLSMSLQQPPLPAG